MSTRPKPGENHRQQDYFVSDPGAAQREAGFHRMLAEYIGWQLPPVRRYDGTETILYLETIFPLLYVEQKAGWSSIPAAFPTYFQIRDAGRRAVEFILALETHHIELKKQWVELELASSNAAWAAKRDDLLAIASMVNARVEGLPSAPSLSSEEIGRCYLLGSDGSDWKPVEEVASSLRGRIAELEQVQTPTVGDVASEAAIEVEHLMSYVADQNAKRSTVFRGRQTEISQKASVTRRLAALEEDLQKNLDAQKLRNLGSTISESFAPDHCPTCTQPIADTLLAQRAGAAIMPVEQNIEYIRAQRGIFQRLSSQADAAIAELNRQLAAATAEVNESSSRLRALRNDLVSASSAPSIAALEERIRSEARLNGLEDALQRFEQQKSALAVLARQHAELLSARNELPSDRLTEKDKEKLVRMGELVREQVASYGFSTFPPSELEISQENYRPQREGFEIGFEMSASDTIRLKWAYQLALLEVARTAKTHHAGLVIFDEPQQQKTAKVSFKKLLDRAALARASGQQVIFATSEDREQLETFLSDIDCHFIAFDTPIVRRVS
jgi:sugar-specific transcriptional regulator TrmB